MRFDETKKIDLDQEKGCFFFKSSFQEDLVLEFVAYWFQTYDEDLQLIGRYSLQAVTEF